MTDYPATLARAARRAAGAFYTPPEIVARVVDEALRGPLAAASWSEDGAPRLRVLDPACGDGRFLVACVERMVAASVARGFAPVKTAIERCVTGVERDPVAAAASGLPDIRVGEALLGGVVADGAWDVVVGNPPWVRSVRLKESDPELWRALRGRLTATSYREWDLYAAFLERALDWVAPGGEIGLVLPSRWLTAAFAAPLRERLARDGVVRRIVDFGAAQVFAGATTYTALVHLRQARSATIDVERDGEQGTMPQQGAGPWLIAVGGRARLVEKLRRAGPPLAAVARVAKGAGSNADPVFLLEPRATGQWSHALGETVDVEPEALVPCLRGRDVGRRGAGRVALLPYEEGRLVPLADLPPRAAAYLARCRALLEAREGGRFTGATFHAWGRPQNLAWLLDATPKVVVPDAAREGRAVIDESGALVIDTAYAVRPLGDVPVSRLAQILDSPIVAAWLRATGIPLRGGYFRMKTAYLASLPIALGDRPLLDSYGVSADELAG